MVTWSAIDCMLNRAEAKQLVELGFRQQLSRRRTVAGRDYSCEFLLVKLGVENKLGMRSLCLQKVQRAR